MVLAVALVAIAIARDPDSRVLGLVSYAWAGFGAAFGPVVLFSLFWKRMTRNGALAGMIVGALTVIVWKQVAIEQLGSGLYEMVPGFLAASASIIVASLLDRVPAVEVLATHELVHAELGATGY
jgi:sodium/proline symporter